MQETRILMGMPITVHVEGAKNMESINKVFEYFGYVDDKFSTYKPESEISLINKKKLKVKDYSGDMKEVFRLSEETKNLTNGYFDIKHKGKIDPSGLVKGWAIYKAAKILENDGFESFYIDAGGDIEARGKKWKVGIRNPFDLEQIVKVIEVKNKGVATSGTYERGSHIYNPKAKAKHRKNLFLRTDVARNKFLLDASLKEIVSITVIGPNIYEADRFATAAFAMQKEGINFIESLKGFEGYMIDSNGIATFTSNFDKYVLE